MRGKILILTGLAVGYVLGARAGRERYEDIKSAANKLWNDPRVQSKVEAVEDFAKDKGPDVADFVTDKAKKVANQVNGKKKPSNGSSVTPKKSGASATTPSTSSSTGSGTTSGSASN